MNIGEVKYKNGRPYVMVRQRKDGNKYKEYGSINNCEICNIEFFAMRMSKGRFCSNKCAGVSMKGRIMPWIIGRKPHNYKGGVSTNPDLRNAYRREYHKKNPFIAKTYNNKRRSLTRDLSRKTVQLVYEDNIKKYGTLTCYLCLKPTLFGKDCLEHKNPLSRGGSNNYDNLEISCNICNFKKRNRTVSEYFKYLKDI